MKFAFRLKRERRPQFVAGNDLPLLRCRLRRHGMFMPFLRAAFCRRGKLMADAPI